MRRSDFGKTPTPANSTTEGPQYNEKEQYPMVGPELQGTPGKQHAAGQKIRQRALNRYETSKQGGHRDMADTHAANVGKKAYVKSGDEPKGRAHDAGARPVAK
jgi:hypothetical protein